MMQLFMQTCGKSEKKVTYNLMILRKSKLNT